MSFEIETREVGKEWFYGDHDESIYDLLEDMYLNDLHGDSSLYIPLDIELDVPDNDIVLERDIQSDELDDYPF